MASGNYTLLTGEGTTARQLEPQWNGGLITASVAISLLGSFTSTQLMCQARCSRYVSGVLVWTTLASLTFGFCSFWSLHEVAMLACELDLPLGINVPLTALSAALAIIFTFLAMAFDILWDGYNRKRRERDSTRKVQGAKSGSMDRRDSAALENGSAEPLLRQPQHEYDDEDERTYSGDLELATSSHRSLNQKSSIELDKSAKFDGGSRIGGPSSAQHLFIPDPAQPSLALPLHNEMLTEIPNTHLMQNHGRQFTATDDINSELAVSESLLDTSSDYRSSRQSSSFMESIPSAFGLSKIISIRAYRKSTTASKNAFVAAGLALYTGFSVRNIFKGFLWSLAVVTMHYFGLNSLRIPQGYVSVDPLLVALASIICWAFCVVGCILIFQIETNLAQQVLFSAVLTCGVAVTHFTGLYDSLVLNLRTDVHDQECEPQPFGLMHHQV
jgi:NO-binding membrane sensor protein with MHYT domain